MTDLPECLRTIERQQWDMERLVVPIDINGTTTLECTKPGYIMDYAIGLSFEKGWVINFIIATERTDATRD